MGIDRTWYQRVNLNLGERCYNKYDFLKSRGTLRYTSRIYEMGVEWWEAATWPNQKKALEGIIMKGKFIKYKLLRPWEFDDIGRF